MNSEYQKNSGAEASDLAGRPTLYDPSFPDKVRSLARLGLPVTTTQLAFFFGVSDRTVERWKVRFPEFCQSIREGRLHTDGLVAEKLFQQATGSEWVEEQVVPTREIVYGDSGRKLREIEGVKVVQVVRRLPPDTKAMKYWLKHRQPEH
jgi:hypothetical protein